MDYDKNFDLGYFSEAQAYNEFSHLDCIAESHQRFGHSERHLQCVWFDPRLRPSRLRTAEGESVCVVHPGRWNLEAGPDFRDAVVMIGKEKRRIHGDVEIHIASKDWTHHKHARDRRYNNVRVHVTYYADDNPADLPPGTIHISLADGLRQSAGFHFEDIDLAAYPFNRHGPVTPCSREFKTLSFETKRALLESAGTKRLMQKTRYFIRQMDSKTPEQVFYEQTLYALGFKNNRNPFRMLARRVPAAQLAKLCPEDAYAALLGVSNLIPSEIPPEWPSKNREFARDCWNRWFRLRNEKEDQIMSKNNWQLAHLRPLNYPGRRIAAAATWFANQSPLLPQILELARNEPADFPKKAERLLIATTHPFWSYSESWKSKVSNRPTALIGKGRADAILINVLTPMLAALKIDSVFEQGLLKNLPLEPSNAIIRETAHRLFDFDHPAALYKTELARQGLIQMFQDHCLCGTPSCTECTLPAQIKKLRAHAYA